MIVACCSCGKVHHNGLWIDKPIPPHVLISHGYCPHCAAAARVEMLFMRLRDSYLTSRAAAAAVA